ncbi:MAG TPA: tol-pal system protein YbgF [Candidatus Acidoferrum sp.]|nr:tol-pal system protein YbgF [Candidatus Acidoferrum sp.]
MRYRNLMWGGAAMLVGALLGSLVGPQPAEAVAKEIIEIQNDIGLLLQGQRSMQNSIDANQGVVKTLLQQNLDAANQQSTALGSLQKSVQDVSANSGANSNTLTTTVQGLSDSIADVNAHIGKLNQQIVDLQSSLQSIDAKLTASATPAAPPAPSHPAADVLYSSAYRDITGGHYDLAKQEFHDYLKYFPGTELASNAQFYLGEISFLQKDYKSAISQYDLVIQNYPNSFKQPAAHVKKGLALIDVGQKSAGTRELRAVVRDFPNSDEAKIARARLRQLGAR